MDLNAEPFMELAEPRRRTCLPSVCATTPHRGCHAHSTQASVVRNAVGSPRKVQAIVRNLEAAMAAAKDGVAREGRRLGPGGTGDCLRTNFALLCDMVLKQDGHLLTDEEHSLLRAFQVQLLPSISLMSQQHG